MKKVYRCLPILLFLFINSACQYQTVIQQERLNTLDRNGAIKPVNIEDYRRQIALIQQTKPQLYYRNIETYQTIEQWLRCLETECTNRLVLLPDFSMLKTDSNVHLTSYYTPVIKVRHKADSVFRYPFYRLPDKWVGQWPSRGDIYAGALNGKKLEIAYSSSLIDNFIMQVQGSGYVDFEQGEPLSYFSYGGKNGYPYQGVGRLLVERGEIAKQELSLQAIKRWSENKSEDELINLLKQNQSFIFFSPKPFTPIIGFAGVPLVAETAVAVDPNIIAMGEVLLVDMPVLEQNGQVVTGRREWRLMVALDVGSAIKGQRLDIYQGVGETAGERAGYYNHYGHVWQLLLNKKERNLTTLQLFKQRQE